MSEKKPAIEIEKDMWDALEWDADHLAGAVLQLAASPALRHRLGDAAAGMAAARSWGRALGQLATGYRRALAEPVAAGQAPSRAA